MSVLIRGMDEIPGDGVVLVVRHDNGKVYIKYANTYGYSIELVELPKKHGRLIDADKLFEEMRCANLEVSYSFDGIFLNISEFANIIQNIVTVIEAEDGT